MLVENLEKNVKITGMILSTTKNRVNRNCYFLKIYEMKKATFLSRETF